MIDLSNLSWRGRKVDLRGQSAAYKRAFGSPEGRTLIMPDLLEFTEFFRPAPVTEGLFMQGRVEGKRDVMLRILGHINLDTNQLYAMWMGNPNLKPGDF